jgi:hypothetical protein
VNTQTTSNADEYSTPIPQGASLGTSPSAADDYSTPIPQGATVGAPAVANGTPSVSADALNLPGNLNAGALHGMAQTGAGAIELAQKMTPAGVIASAIPGVKGALDTAKNWLDQHSQNTGTDSVSRFEQGTGNVIEGLGEFLLGDEVLKGATLSQRLLSSGKLAKAIESSPRLTAVVKAGLQALGRGAALGGAQGAVKSGGDAGATIGGAVAGGVGNVVIPGAINSAKELPALFDTLKSVVKPGVIQDAFQGDIRRIINEAAQEHGVATSGAASIRDVANDVSNSLQARAKAGYQALDNATGGRVQRFSDSIKAVQKKLSNLNGIATPDDEGAWVGKLNELTDAHEKAMQEAEAAGVPRALLDQANGDYKKAMAMADLNRAIRASSEGLRPELASGANKPLPEKVNTGKLFNRVNKLYDSGRLQEAVGAERSGDLLRATNDAQAASQTAQNLRQLAGSTARHTLYYGATWELLKHLLGE